MLREIKNFGKSLLLGTAFAMLLPLWAHASTPGEVSRQALQLAGNQQYSQAIDLINAQNTDIRESYDIRYTKARILAWSGDHKASAAEYDSLLAQYPGNADVLNGYGYLEYYRGDLKASERYFNQVLAIAPKYEDAQRGIERVQAARAEKKKNSHSWRIDLNAGLNSFDNGLTDWNHQSVRAEYLPGEVAIYGGATRYERFDLNDIQFLGGVRSNNDSNWDWEIGGGFTPSADFRPDVTGLARVGHKVKIGGNSVLHGSIGYQLDDYEAAGTIHQITPQLMAYLENGMVFTTRLIHVRQKFESNQTGFLVSGLAPITDRLNARLGYANAPESVFGVVVDTESIFGGLAYQLNDNLEIHGTYSRDDRKEVYISDGFNVGLTQKY